MYLVINRKSILLLIIFTFKQILTFSVKDLEYYGEKWQKGEDRDYDGGRNYGEKQNFGGSLNGGKDAGVLRLDGEMVRKVGGGDNGGFLVKNGGFEENADDAFEEVEYGVDEIKRNFGDGGFKSKTGEYLKDVYGEKKKNEKVSSKEKILGLKEGLEKIRKRLKIARFKNRSSENKKSENGGLKKIDKKFNSLYNFVNSRPLKFSNRKQLARKIMNKGAKTEKEIDSASSVGFLYDSKKRISSVNSCYGNEKSCLQKAQMAADLAGRIEINNRDGRGRIKSEENKEDLKYMGGKSFLEDSRARSAWKHVGSKRMASERNKEFLKTVLEEILGNSVTLNAVTSRSR